MVFLNKDKLCKDIIRIDKKLLKQIEQGKITENFGQRDVNKLEDKYSELIRRCHVSRNMIRTFSEYCATIENQGNKGFFDSTAWTGKPVFIKVN